ncbi:MAG: AbrB/MazE/SpoVT family DNA-binding domain-containing protein [Chloroflexi bacterium]|nr:AbrB/MazE/SpoVT family DNA-binding domain-containing protein [Chloroflexota bacterium]
MLVKAKKWGDDIAIRIPAKLVKAMNLNDGDVVAMTVENNQIVIRSAPSPRPTYTLEELLAGITDENRHPEIRF